MNGEGRIRSERHLFPVGGQKFLLSSERGPQRRREKMEYFPQAPLAGDSPRLLQVALHGQAGWSRRCLVEDYPRTISKTSQDSGEGPGQDPQRKGDQKLSEGRFVVR